VPGPTTNARPAHLAEPAPREPKLEAARSIMIDDNVWGVIVNLGVGIQ
jgi:hypothetical protein